MPLKKDCLPAERIFMKLLFDVKGRHQPDPFIFEDDGKLYLYVTGVEGVGLYSADDLFGIWHYEGIVATWEGHNEFWAPSVIKLDGKYYMYVSCSTEEEFEFMRVASSSSPLGPFGDWNTLYQRFSIDSHVVKTDAGLFLWYAEDNVNCDRVGTRIFVDRLIDPVTVANAPKEMIIPTMDEEIFMRNRFGDGRDWHTIEGPFWFREGEWQYVMYSGGCYENDSYHIGYAAVRSDESDHTKLELTKNTDNGDFAPVLIKNEFEEGTGHHSVIKYKGEYYAIYHGRDLEALNGEYREERTARVCRLHVREGKITAERYIDSI